MTMTTPAWRGFERLVAAIHRAATQGATIAWNDHIDGRQFDVTVRFRSGHYDYLTVIECKDSKAPVAAEQVDALVTKARDVKADKAVIVSSSGFQSGALTVARRHGIEAFTLEKALSLPEDQLLSEIQPILRVNSIVLSLPRPLGEYSLPEDRNLPAFLANHLTVTSSTNRHTLDSLVQSVYSDLLGSASERPKRFRIPLPKGSVAFIPHLREEHPVEAVSFTYYFDSLRLLKAEGVDPHVLRGYEFRNAHTGEIRHVPGDTVANRFDTVLRPGCFYLNPGLEFSYYCKGIKDGVATLFLLESYQHGRLIQAVFTQDISYQGQFVEITDPVEIARLRRLGAHVFANHGAA